MNINGKDYEITGYADDGLPIIKAEAVSVQDGFDEDGNPRISTQISVPAITIGATPGRVG